MLPEILVPVVLLCLLVGLPLAILGVVVGLWLRRSRHEAAIRPFVGCVISGAISFSSFTTGLALLIALALRDHRTPGYVDEHPLRLVPLIVLGMLALLSACATIAFGLWTVWRVVRAPSVPAAPNPGGPGAPPPLPPGARAG